MKRYEQLYIGIGLMFEDKVVLEAMSKMNVDIFKLRASKKFNRTTLTERAFDIVLACRRSLRTRFLDVRIDDIGTIKDLGMAQIAVPKDK